MAGELFKMMTGTDMLLVSYRGGSAFTDLLGGQVQVMFPTTMSSIGLLRPKVTLEEGSDIERAKALHEKAHNICVVANSMNFPVHYEPEVISAGGSVAAA